MTVNRNVKVRNGTVRFPDSKNNILPTFVKPKKKKKMSSKELEPLRQDSKRIRKLKNIDNK